MRSPLLVYIHCWYGWHRLLASPTRPRNIRPASAFLTISMKSSIPLTTAGSRAFGVCLARIASAFSRALPTMSFLPAFSQISRLVPVAERRDKMLRAEIFLGMLLHQVVAAPGPTFLMISTAFVVSLTSMPRIARSTEPMSSSSMTASSWAPAVVDSMVPTQVM